MLAPGNYIQWKSIIKRYIDTKPNHELIHYCLKNPPYVYKYMTPNPDATPVTPEGEGTSEPRRGKIILMGIDNDIYSTVDACPNEWRCGKQLKGLNKNQDLKNVSYHKLYDILKQYQTKVNDVRAERLASATRNHSKAIINSPPPPYVTVPEVEDDDDSSSKDKEDDRLLALITTTLKKIYKPTNNNLRTSSNPRNLHVDNTPRSNRSTGYARQGGQYENQRAVNVVGARDNVGTQVVQKTESRAHRQEQQRTRCTQASEESNLPDGRGLTEEHQLLQGLHGILYDSGYLHSTVLGHHVLQLIYWVVTVVSWMSNGLISTKIFSKDALNTLQPEMTIHCGTTTSDAVIRNVARQRNEEQQSLLKLLRSLNPNQLRFPVEEPAHDDEEADIQRALELRKGKEKVVEEQAAHDLLTLQTPKKKSPTEQFIFQRRNPSYAHESSSTLMIAAMDAELNLTDSETESDEEASKINARNQEEGQAGPNPGVQDEGQLTNLKPEQMDEEFTTTAYPNVQENLKLLTEDQFFMEKPQEEELRKTNTEAEVQSMVSVPIHQDTSSVPPMTTPVIDLMKSQSDSNNLNNHNNNNSSTTTTSKHHRSNPSSSHITPPGSPPTQPPPSPPLVGASGAPGTSGASGSSQLPPPLPPLSTGTSGSLSPSDDLNEDDSIPEEQVLLSDDEDSENDHQPKADSRKDWWKPLPEEERPLTPEPAWVIPSSSVSDVENNWASALVSISETPAENSVLAKTGDMTTFMKWYFQQVNKTKLTQVDFDGQAYEVVKAFYPDVIYLQFQMEECYKMLTYHIDWTNPEGDQVRVDVNQPLPLGGPPNMILCRIEKMSEHTCGFLVSLESKHTQDTDYRVKEFKVKRLNSGMNTRFGTKKDVIRSKEFISAIESVSSQERIAGSGGKLRQLPSGEYRDGL
ncbi:hypothetical protein Tco_0289683 [Tanacetum coccineum]